MVGSKIPIKCVSNPLTILRCLNLNIRGLNVENVFFFKSWLQYIHPFTVEFSDVRSSEPRGYVGSVIAGGTFASGDNTHLPQLNPNCPGKSIYSRYVPFFVQKFFDNIKLVHHVSSMFESFPQFLSETLGLTLGRAPRGFLAGDVVVGASRLGADIVACAAMAGALAYHWFNGNICKLWKRYMIYEACKCSRTHFLLISMMS